ncbi:MAG TPA: PDC sensor domain-containing protein [Burkholderiales bacterium]|nr:PDC sensor domain-containing protein [Burkholderiales bacterium]
MSGMSYLAVVERYHQYRNALSELLSSILTGMGDTQLLSSDEARHKAMNCVVTHYPFVELLYLLDEHGRQITPNIAAGNASQVNEGGEGRDRSMRPYFKQAMNNDGVSVTAPYLSSASNMLCVSAIMPLCDPESGGKTYVVLDINLTGAIEFMMGDHARRRFLPVFRAVYIVIVLGLAAVTGVLLYAAFGELIALHEVRNDSEALHLKPFGVIIFLTLALAIFDLGKTILEEEVLMHKDIFRHSSTRRTITRFIAAILIAVSIEALLLMFKSALGVTHEMVEAVWMMFAAVGLLVGLGLYVYLGARAEALLSAPPPRQ